MNIYVVVCPDENDPDRFYHDGVFSTFEKAQKSVLNKQYQFDADFTWDIMRDELGVREATASYKHSHVIAGKIHSYEKSAFHIWREEI